MNYYSSPVQSGLSYNWIAHYTHLKPFQASNGYSEVSFHVCWQAQATAAQELEASRAAKVRKEQLALRQSKQLIPVMPNSKAKHPTSSLPVERPLLTTLKKPSGMSLLTINISQLSS